METVIGLYEQLEQELHHIQTETTGILEMAKLSYLAVESAMTELKAFITAHTFKDEQEEIYFFKELKPRFYSRLIYFIRLFEIETNKPEGSEQKHLKKQLGAIKRYSQDNITFYKYHRSGATYMDSAYFTRDKFDLMVGFDISYFDCDPLFCTSHDYKLAILLANEQLVIYINERLAELNRPSTNTATLLQDLDLSWAETKVSLIELIYALQSVGAFYNIKTRLKADLKDITKFFELTLGVKLSLSETYRGFYDIRLRKKEPLVFIKKIGVGLINKIDESNN